jgi:hypothetical protein
MRALDEAVGRVRFERRHALLVVAVAMLADYLSPAAMWTAALPLMFMAVLLTFRQRKAALAVLFLSSWILVPTLAAVTCAFHAVRGEPVGYAVRHAGITTGQVCSLRRARTVDVTVEVDLGLSRVHRTNSHSTRAIEHIVIDVEGDGPLASAQANVTASFAILHNWMTTFGGDVECRPRTAADDLPAALQPERWPFNLR